MIQAHQLEVGHIVKYDETVWSGKYDPQTEAPSEKKGKRTNLVRVTQVKSAFEDQVMINMIVLDSTGVDALEENTIIRRLERTLQYGDLVKPTGPTKPQEEKTKGKGKGKGKSKEELHDHDAVPF